jgi:Xaa-Pro aminopeptidase
MKRLDVSPATYAGRRARLAQAMQSGVAVVPTAPERIRNRDTHYPFRFDSHFWYLSGFPEPEAVLVIVAGEAPRSVLFCRERSEEREIWDGFRYGPERAREQFGVAEQLRETLDFEHLAATLERDRYCAYGWPFGNGKIGSVVRIAFGHAMYVRPFTYCITTGEERSFWPAIGVPGGKNLTP